MSTYYIWTGDKQTGPFNLNQLRALWRAGSVTGEMYFKIHADEEWMGQLNQLSDKLDDKEVAREKVRLENPRKLNRARREELRRASCYSGLRSLIDVLSALYGLGAFILAVQCFITSYHLGRDTEAIVSPGVWWGAGVGFLFLSGMAFAIRGVGYALLDIADVHVESSR